jgi:hypothetical protein
VDISRWDDHNYRSILEELEVNRTLDEVDDLEEVKNTEKIHSLLKNVFKGIRAEHSSI